MGPKKQQLKDIELIFSYNTDSQECSQSSTNLHHVKTSDQIKLRNERRGHFCWPRDLPKKHSICEITHDLMRSVHADVLQCLENKKINKILNILEPDESKLQYWKTEITENINEMVLKVDKHYKLSYDSNGGNSSLTLFIDENIDPKFKIRSKLKNLKDEKQSESQKKLMNNFFSRTSKPASESPKCNDTLVGLQAAEICNLAKTNNDRARYKNTEGRETENTNKNQIQNTYREERKIENNEMRQSSSFAGLLSNGCNKANKKKSSAILETDLQIQTGAEIQLEAYIINEEEPRPTDRSKSNIPANKADDQHEDDDISTVTEDEGELPEVYGSNEEDTEPIGPFYFPSQTYLANKIVERMKLIYDCYHNGKKLSEFNGFDFRIYTPKSNMLEKQTWTRLSKKQSGCLSEKLYEGSDIRAKTIAKEKVHKYIPQTIDSVHKKLLEEVSEQKDTLFLIVADEAHWGITEEDQARRMLVDTWNDKDHPNVIVLLVTATPYNLLSQDSYLPRKYFKFDNSGTPSFEDENNINPHDIRENLYKKLHHVKWTESFSQRVKKGLVVKLKIPMKSASGRTVQLCSVKLKEEENFLHWTKTPDDNSPVLDQYLIKENENSRVTIQTEDAKWTLVIENKKVKFIQMNENSPSDLISEFCILNTYGEGVILITHSNKEELLYYDDSYEEVSCRRYRVSLTPTDFEVPLPEYSFLLEQSRPSISSEFVQDYISLNYYFNSMRNEKTIDQLIREDATFQKMSTAVKKILNEGHTLSKKETEESICDILTAEYSYYILITNLVRQHSKKLSILKNKYQEERDARLNAFMKELARQHSQNKENEIHPIQLKQFVSVVSFISDKAYKTFEINSKHFAEDRPTGDDVPTEDLLNSFISCIIHMNKAKLNKFVYCKKHELVCHVIEEYLTNQNLSDKTCQILKDSETGRIVDGLIPKEFDKVEGEMKIIRVKQTSHGDKMYKTLCIARKLSSANDYVFEVLRDYDKSTLSKDFEGKLESKMEMTASYRIRRRLQPKKCTFIDDYTLESCNCNFKTSKKFRPRPNLKCYKCNHMHKTIEKYTDIEGLPCVLILVHKGRLGDTFPQSFNAMDLRLCYRDKGDDLSSHNETMTGKSSTTKLYLSSLVQEFGRLCRYTKLSDEKPLPYALVGGYLATVLKNSLKEGAVHYSCLELPNAPVVQDSKIKKSVQHENTKDTSNNRILLHAEPQIGKTGVYLKVISRLHELLGQVDSEEMETDEETDSDEEEDEKNTEAVDGERSESTYWNYPYWKDMVIGNKLPTVKIVGKHTKYFGDYEYGKPPKFLPVTTADISHMQNSLPGKCKKRNSRLQDFQGHLPIENNCFRAYNHKDHNSCDECHVQYETKEMDLSFQRKLQTCGENSFENAQIRFKLSIPLTTQYKHVQDYIEKFANCRPSISNNLKSDCQTCKTNCLKTWIFIPTHSRAYKGYFHLYHTMVNNENLKACHYVTVLVVRSSDFPSYSQLWKSAHAILQLPDSLPGEERDVHEGGIGFARRAIQIFAESLGLSWVFMLDDNISYATEVITDGSCIMRKDDGSLDEHKVPLFKVLKHLEQQIDGTIKDLPEHEFEAYDEDNNSLEKYTGPVNTYGVIGLKKHRATIYRTKNPFLKTHVYSLVLLNIRKLQEEQINYKTWHVFEDLTLNNDCDSKNLWVCKYNRFTIMKHHMKTWIPKVFHWTAKTVLANRSKPSAENSTDILISWLRSVCTVKLDGLPEIPMENENMLSDGDKEIGNMMKKIQECNRNGKYKMFVITNRNFQTCRDTIFLHEQEHFINGSIILLSNETCLKRQLTTKMLIEKWVQKITSIPSLKVEVVTSHNVEDYDTKIILVIAKVPEPRASQDQLNKSSNPVKRLADERIAGPSKDVKRIKQEEGLDQMTEIERERQSLLEIIIGMNVEEVKLMRNYAELLKIK